MKLPEDSVIPQEKLLRYLLLPQKENDKSKFLASAGYTLANWQALKHDLRKLIQRQDVLKIEASPYGTKYEVRGTLSGIHGHKLHVITIWIKLEATGETRFVTLFPDREVNKTP